MAESNFLIPPWGFTGGLNGKESVCNAGDPALIPGLGRCPEDGNGYPLHHSCLENSMARGNQSMGWQTDMTEQLLLWVFVSFSCIVMCTKYYNYIYLSYLPNRVQTS